MIQQKIQGIANSNFDKVSLGTAEFRVYSASEILKKSLKQLGLYWGLSLVSILLPVVHFILVPLFFILGILFAARARKFHLHIMNAQLSCPQCGYLLEIKDTPFHKQHVEICQKCASVVKISMVV